MRAKFAYTGIRVSSMDESISFYTDVMGMKLVRRFKIGETKGEIATLSSEEDEILELNWYDRESQFYSDYVAGEALDHLAFRVDSLEAAVNEAESKGYPVKAEIRAGNSRWCYIQDPNGIWIELFE
ncbi:MAG: VOC family protein [Conexivisphaerales archaeon]